MHLQISLEVPRFDQYLLQICCCFKDLTAPIVPKTSEGAKDALFSVGGYAKLKPVWQAVRLQVSICHA